MTSTSCRPAWLASLQSQIYQRDLRERIPFEEIEQSYVKILDENVNLNARVGDLSQAVVKFKQENWRSNRSANDMSKLDDSNDPTIKMLKSDNDSLRKELMDVYRLKKEHEEALSRLKKQAIEHENLIIKQSEMLDDFSRQHEGLEKSHSHLTNEKDKLESNLTLLNSESVELRKAHDSAVVELEKYKNENRRLAEKLMKYKETEMKQMNEWQQEFEKYRIFNEQQHQNQHQQNSNNNDNSITNSNTNTNTNSNSNKNTNSNSNTHSHTNTNTTSTSDSEISNKNNIQNNSGTTQVDLRTPSHIQSHKNKNKNNNNNNNNTNTNNNNRSGNILKTLHSTIQPKSRGTITADGRSSDGRKQVSPRRDRSWTISGLFSFASNDNPNNLSGNNSRSSSNSPHKNDEEKEKPSSIMNLFSNALSGVGSKDDNDSNNSNNNSGSSSGSGKGSKKNRFKRNSKGNRKRKNSKSDNNKSNANDDFFTISNGPNVDLFGPSIFNISPPQLVK